MTRSSQKAVAAAAILSLAIVAPAVSREADSFDLGISKRSSGPFLTGAQDSDPASANPQVVKRDVSDGTSGIFYFRLKNLTANDDGTYLRAPVTTVDYQVTYKLNGVDVTPEIAGCNQIILLGGEKVVYRMKVVPSGADPGDKKTFGVKTVESSCTDPTDAAYAKVTVTP